MASKDTYAQLIEFLDEHKAHYRLIDHKPEGRTEFASKLRGNPLSAAAHCIVLMVKKGKATKYVLVVVPGDAKIDLNAIKELLGSTYVSFADKKIAEKLAGSVSGTVLPFSFNPDLELIVDPSLLRNKEIYFNAARLDCSMALLSSDYKKLSRARFEHIAQHSKPTVHGPKKGLSIETKRHSLSHILAQAVLEMFPDARLGIGPDIENGFYYDFELPRTLIPEDLPILEKKMKHIIKQNQKFEQYKEPAMKSVQYYKKLKQDYKAELIADLKKDGEKEVSFYKNGPFVDLCRGPHVASTGQIDVNSFKLDKIAGAYWRGSEDRPMLQRIYGLAFDTPKELDAYVTMMREAEKRDHRRIGKELDLFVFSELVGAGLPLFTPKGTRMLKAISDFLNQMKEERGYEQVDIPHLAKVELYKTSGHWEKFSNDIFHVKGQSEEFLLKPMNCPHHIQIFASRPRSYRDMPQRYAEITKQYRDEQTGELHGLSRVRSISIDDTHIFARQDQIQEEAKRAYEIIVNFYKALGMELTVRLSTRDPKGKSKYLGSDAVWESSEKALKKFLKEEKIEHFLGEGEAAFYGPKLDFMGKDSIGRTWQLATIQLDFNQPERFQMEYTDDKGKAVRPIMLHIAVAGALERVLSVIIEHFAGAFPVWLAPVQAAVIPVASAHEKYAREVYKKLKDAGVYVEYMEADETLGKRIRTAEKQKYPYMLVVGDKEVESKSVAVRSYHTKEQNVVKTESFLKSILEEIAERRLPGK